MLAIRHVKGDTFVKLMKMHQGKVTYISDSDQEGKSKVEYEISWFDELMLSLHMWFIDRRSEKGS